MGLAIGLGVGAVWLGFVILYFALSYKFDKSKKENKEDDNK